MSHSGGCHLWPGRGVERRRVAGQGAAQASGTDARIVLARQALHAYELTVQHPRSKEETTFTAPLPEDMGQVLALLETEVE